MARFSGVRNSMGGRRRGARKAGKRSKVKVKVKVKIKGSPTQVRRAIKKMADGGEDPNAS